MDLLKIADNIELNDLGIYFAKNRSEISYPKDGNQRCFQIEEKSYWFIHRNNIIAEIVKLFSPKDVLFDIGGGNGFVSGGLLKAGIQTVLVEPGLDGILNAKKRGIPNIISASMEDAGFKLSSLPAAGLFDVIEHIEDDRRFLEKLYNYLMEGAYLYITAPAYNSLWSFEDKRAGHYRRYTLKEISSTLKKIGFTIEYQTYFFSFLPLPIIIFRKLLYHLRFNKDKTTRVENDLQPKSRIINFFINTIMDREFKRIKKLRRIPIGSSCLIVARKKKQFQLLTK